MLSLSSHIASSSDTAADRATLATTAGANHQLAVDALLAALVTAPRALLDDDRHAIADCIAVFVLRFIALVGK